MLRAASHAPWDPFSPALLRADPGALAAWIRFHVTRWILCAPFEQTNWIRRERRGERGDIVVGTNAGATLELWNGRNAVTLAYRFDGVGLAVGVPMPESVLQRLPAPSLRFATSSLWIPRQAGATSGHACRIDDLVAARSCAVVRVGELMGPRLAPRDNGTPGALLLLGVQPDLRAALQGVATYTRRLGELATAPATHATRYAPGYTRTAWVPVDRAAPGGGVDLHAIQEDVQRWFCGYGFKGALFLGDVRDGNAHRLDLASVHLGEITGVFGGPGPRP